MKTVTGNVVHALLGDESVPAIVLQQVNCQGVMGSGVAAEIRRVFPEVFYQYKRLVDERDMLLPTSQLLGKLQVVEVMPNKYVANLFGQDFFGRDGTQYTSYEALDRALQSLAQWVVAHNLDVAEIHHPLFGAGLGGGSWQIIRGLIEANLGTGTTLWVPPGMTPRA